MDFDPGELYDESYEEGFRAHDKSDEKTLTPWNFLKLQINKNNN